MFVICILGPKEPGGVVFVIGNLEGEGVNKRIFVSQWIEYRSNVHLMFVAMDFGSKPTLQDSKQPEGPLGSVTCSLIFMQFNGQNNGGIASHSFYWPENATDWTTDCISLCVMWNARGNKLQRLRLEWPFFLAILWKTAIVLLKKIDFVLACVCTVIYHRWSHSGERTKKYGERTKKYGTRRSRWCLSGQTLLIQIFPTISSEKLQYMW